MEIRYADILLGIGTFTDHCGYDFQNFDLEKLIYPFDIDFVPTSLGINLQDGSISLSACNTDKEYNDEASFSIESVTYKKDY